MKFLNEIGLKSQNRFGFANRVEPERDAIETMSDFFYIMDLVKWYTMVWR